MIRQLIIVSLALSTPSHAQQMDYPYKPVPFTSVKVADAFWAPRFETNRKVTVRYDFEKCEETGRIDNFAKAGGLMEGEFEGRYYNDSDVYKVIEGAAYTLAQHPDPELAKYLDDLIAKIAAAQEEDGYLYTNRTIDPQNTQPAAGKERWSLLRHSHELYNVGHMYEAAVAHHRATGKRNLLDVALKNAALITSVFGPEGKHDVPGHQEIEIGLVKLFRLTGEKKYLDLAHFFLDQRGRAEHRELYGEYCQDHAPVVEQAAAVGHAVRAGYMYCGMADVAALTGDARFLKAIDRIWEDVVTGKLYLTGGIGARRGGEAFGERFELPNGSAYNETCAAIANALWNYRMFLLHGDAKYIDVLERVIYNGFLSGISLSGDRFFYPNPLSFDGEQPFNMGAPTRQPWFSCSCCPVNVVRFIPSIAGFVYAQREREVYVNLYIGGEGMLEVDGKPLRITQRTRYPWDGKVEITVEPGEAREFTLCLRIPGWARDCPAPGDLYGYRGEETWHVKLDAGKVSQPPSSSAGYLRIAKTWKPGDVVHLELNMPIRTVRCDDRVAANRGRIAFERGPVVYCAEAVDNGGKVRDLVLPEDTRLSEEWRPDLLGGVVVLRGEAQRVSRPEPGGALVTKKVPFTAIPYHVWDHREVGEMEVWLASTPEQAELPKPPTVASRSRASASHCWQGDRVQAINDQREPQNSSDHSIPRLTWWDHRGTREWAQLDLPAETEVSGVSLYWFDDTGVGGCRVPASWRLLHRVGEEWKEVEAKGAYGVQKDAFNDLEFTPVRTSALRVEVQLREGYSGGILEWKVDPRG